MPEQNIRRVPLLCFFVAALCLGLGWGDPVSFSPAEGLSAWVHVRDGALRGPYRGSTCSRVLAGSPLPPPAISTTPFTRPGAVVWRGSSSAAALVTHVLARRQPRDGLHVRGERRGGGQRHEPCMPGGRAVHLWLQPRCASQGPAEGLAVGRLRGQHRIWISLRQGVRRRARTGTHPRQGVLRERAHPHEPAQQRGRPQGECPRSSRRLQSLSLCSPYPPTKPGLFRSLPLPLPLSVGSCLFVSVSNPLSIFPGFFLSPCLCFSLPLIAFLLPPTPDLPKAHTQATGLSGEGLTPQKGIQG